MSYLLVFVDTFSNWVECFPCRTAQAREVVKVLLREIIPRFGLPKGIGSDNGPHFIAQITQKVSEFLGISWHLHTPWRPQSSGKVEHMNQTSKRHLAKICQEAQLKWPEALPLALLRVRVAPHSKLGLSPFEIMYGKPYTLSLPMGTEQQLHVLGEGMIREYVWSLVSVLSSIHQQVRDVLQSQDQSPAPENRLLPGSYALVKDWNEEPLRARWKGPYRVLLTTPTAAKLEGIKTWIHSSRLKLVAGPEQEGTPADSGTGGREQWKVEPIRDLKFLFRRKEL
ncbi:uncharacterized protein LOC132251198 [Alligator mississippiensis]|uniref:uncharacterized protein LOC132251198 n=1 Tax=Alligator mississippiensis TaxID=8496 RepID=UPI002877BC9B|nr:uncharacterized protein LOC132251198 [Alligator mississippiensis]